MNELPIYGRDGMVDCPCGRHICFGPLGDGFFIGFNDVYYDEFLNEAIRANWPDKSWPVDVRSTKTLDDLEERFYHCKCGRLLWHRPGKNTVKVYTPEEEEW